MKKLLFFLLLAIFVLGCEYDDGYYPVYTPYPTPAPRSIVIDVTSTSGSGLVTITFIQSGDQVQYANYPTPWNYSYTGRQYDYLNLTVKNMDSNGNITATVTVGGTVWKSLTSYGGGCELKLSGNIP